MTSSSEKIARDNRANQLNPHHPAYHLSRGCSPAEALDLAAHFQPALDNHGNQLNPNNPAHQAVRDKPMPAALAKLLPRKPRNP
jgi:hypothetical protein